MVLALNRARRGFQEVRRAGHKPDSNLGMRGRDVTAHVFRHATVSARLDPPVLGRRERSFKDEVRNGRTAYGSGRKLAQEAQLKLTVDKGG